MEQKIRDILRGVNISGVQQDIVTKDILNLWKNGFIVSDSVVADINNKLSPPLNLCVLLNGCEHRFSDNEKLNAIIKKEIKNTEQSVEYLSNICENY